MVGADDASSLGGLRPADGGVAGAVLSDSGRAAHNRRLADALKLPQKFGSAAVSTAAPFTSFAIDAMAGKAAATYLEQQYDAAQQILRIVDSAGRTRHKFVSNSTLLSSTVANSATKSAFLLGGEPVLRDIRLFVSGFHSMEFEVLDVVRRTCVLRLELSKDRSG
jgi:hypothetical protein